MTQVRSSRITVICAAAQVDALNQGTDFDMRDANWQDATGARFAVISFISDGAFDPKKLGLESFETCQAETVQALRADRVQVVLGGDGAAALEKLGLSPVLPLC